MSGKVLRKILLIAILIGIFSLNNVNAKEVENEIPSYFNLADNYNLKVENQGAEGNCWAFASLNSLETYLMMHGYGEYDFSEIHLSYIESIDFYNTKGQNNNRRPNDPIGGNFEEAMDYITSGYGPVLEEDFPYSERYKTDDYDRLLNVQPLAYVGSYITFQSINKEDDQFKTSDSDKETIRKQVKQHIMENGSVTARVIAPQHYNDIYNNNTAAEYIPAYLEVYEEYGEYRSFGEYPHLVSIIGWDDNYSRENFNEKFRPEKDGAYIILNSWGKEFGKEGIYYISYEDKFIEKNMYGILEASTNKDDLNTLTKLQFKDRNLYKKLKEVLGKKIVSYNDLTQELTFADASVKSLEKLDLSGCEIGNISGLEAFKNLRVLNLSNNNINNLSPISELKNLQELYLKNCGITDISGIFTQEFINAYIQDNVMTILDLSENRITNLNVLANLPEIKELHLSEVGLNNYNLGQISYVKVNTLDISNNIELTNITVLNDLMDLNEEAEGYQKKSLCNLNISYNKNINLTTIPAGLEGLYLENMELTNDKLNGINFQGIKDLSLAYNNGITSLDNINDKSNISQLDLSGNTQISIANLLDQFPRLYKFAYRNSNISSIMPLLQYKERDNEYLGRIRVGIQLLDLSYNNIDLSENDYEQLQAIIDSKWISEINLSHNKTTDFANLNTGDHDFSLDLSYNNIYPQFYTPTFISKIDNQNYTSDIYIDTERINDFRAIANNLILIYNTRHSIGVSNILEINGADLDVKNVSFIITNNPGEQATVKINGGKYKNSTITYNIKRKDNIALEGLLLIKNPDKRLYVEGENFDPTGMKIYGLYSNQSYSELNDYEIINGENLQKGQNNIIIRKDGVEWEIEIISEINSYDEIEEYSTIILYSDDQLEEIKLEEKALYDVFSQKLNNIISKDATKKTIVIPKSELENIYELIIKNDELKSLNGLNGILPNLSSIYIGGKNVSSLKAIKNYNLYSLTLENNEKLTNLSDLKDCETFSSLKLINTKITDINNLKNLTELNVDSYVVPTFDQIKNNLRTINITQRTKLSEIELNNNIFTLPNYMQDILNGKVPTRIEEQMEGTTSEAKIYYIVKDEQYANSTKTKELELKNDNGVWKIDLKEFIKDNSVKNRYIKVTVNVMGEYGRIASFNFIINNDGAKILERIEIKNQDKLTFEIGEKISLTDIPVYKVYSNGEKELITNYTINEKTATKDLKSITIKYSENGISCEVEVPIEVKEHVHEWGEWVITKYPTKSEEGKKERVCLKNNSHKETGVIEKLTEDKYHIIETKNIVWIRGSNKSVILKSEADFEKFETLIIDKKIVEGKFYKVTKGSTIIEIKPEYLEQLEDGIHNYIVKFKDGEASGELIVRTETVEPEDEKPGDNTPINDKTPTNKAEEKNVEPENNDTTESENINRTSPKTGDNIMIYVIIGIVSIVGLVAVVVYRKVSKKNKE